jgi:hypothetical protein
MNEIFNKDLEIAKIFLKKENLSLIFIKNGKVLYSSKESGINSFIEAIDKCGENLKNSSLADKVVGLAIAMLSVYIEVASIYACIISKFGINYLKENGIPFIYEKEVEIILNKNRKEVCPFEKIAMQSKTPKEVYLKIKELIKSF